MITCHFCHLPTRGTQTVVLVLLCFLLVGIQLSTLSQFAALVSTTLVSPVSVNDSDTESPLSILSQWDDLSNDKKRFEPGPYLYAEGQKNIYLTGASITGDYHDRDALWLQIFALGEKPLFRKRGDEFLCDFHNFPLPSTKDEMPRKEALKVQDLEEIGKEHFSCKVGDKQAKLELIPDMGIDSNTNNVIQVWRCPLFGVNDVNSLLSKMDASLFRQGLTDDGKEMALTVEILHENENEKNAPKQLIEINFPSMEPNVGMNKPTSTTTQPALRGSSSGESVIPMLQQRYNSTLCTIAWENGIVNLPEYVRYNLDILGVDHIHLGIHNPKSDSHMSQAMGVANHLMQKEIDAGKLTMSAMSWDDSIGFKCPRAIEQMQTSFNQECLYRAKSTSEFVAVWDLDEYLVWKDQSVSSEDKQNPKLAERLRKINHKECEDWAFVTFESSTAGKNIGESSMTRMVGLDYPHREKATNRVWQKSISRTKNVFLTSIHIPGSSLPAGKISMSDLQVMVPADNKCAFYMNTADAIVIHARSQGKGSQVQIKDPIPNELIAYLGGVVPDE